MVPFRHPGSIGVFDSGIGGLTVANAISGRLPRESLLYVADNARAPYGPRPAEDIRSFSFAITKALLGAGAKLIVVACNTATSAAVDALRAAWPTVPFVGMEPAVKPAASGRRILIMATAATLRSTRYRRLRDRHLTGRTLGETACPELVPLIEAGDPAVGDYLDRVLRPYLRRGVDTIVLGCTHYPLVRDRIAELAGPDVRIVDPSVAAAAQVGRLLNKHDLHRPVTAAPAEHRFHCTGVLAPLQRTLYELPQLNARRRWLAPAPAL